MLHFLSRKIAPAASDGQAAPRRLQGPLVYFIQGAGVTTRMGAPARRRSAPCTLRVRPGAPQQHGGNSQAGLRRRGAFHDANAARRRPGRTAGLHSLAAALFLAVTVLHAVGFKARCGARA
jgi:hypothetical protein